MLITPEEKQKYYFTFGSGQDHDGCYVVYFGTFNEARKNMFTDFGVRWSMQYSEKQWANPSPDTIDFNNLDPKDKPNMAQVWGWREIK